MGIKNTRTKALYVSATKINQPEYRAIVKIFFFVEDGIENVVMKKKQKQRAHMITNL